MPPTHAGCLLDNIGPRACGFIGELLWCTGLVMLAMSSEAFPAYFIASAIIGAGVNCVAFPAFILVDDFPEHATLVSSLVTAAQGAQSIIAPIMELIVNETGYWTFKRVLLMHLAIFCLPVAVLYVALLPVTREAHVQDKFNAAATRRLETMYGSRQRVTEISPKYTWKGFVVVRYSQVDFLLFVSGYSLLALAVGVPTQCIGPQ
eukprot:GHVO01014226.1.p1 GENE.GHVO01014226.1~~GHVO01014226.1.p1  ORF type:complete len:205 (-),score=26.26 GHVO01014226.1:240-854(-)